MKWNHRKVLWLGLLLCVGALAGCQCGDALPVEKAPKLQATPGTLVFEATTLGQTLERDVVLQNVGDKVVNIGVLSVVNQAAGSPFTLVTQKATPFQLEPDDSLRLKIRYAPKQAGSASGYIRVISDASNADAQGLFKIDLRSSELSAALVASPNPLDFGIVAQGASVKKALKIINRGSIVLNIESASLDKDDLTEFVLTSKHSYPIKLSPGNSVTMELSYSPKKPLADSFLVLKNNSAIPKQTVRLVGQIAAPKIEVLPKQLAFSNGVGATTTKRITLYNRGMLTLEVKSIRWDDKSSKEFSFVRLPSFPLKVEPEKSTVLEVAYHATDVKSDSGSILIQSNDPNAPEVKVVVTGKAQGCYLQSSPEMLHFTEGGTKQFALANLGNRNCVYKTAYFGENTSLEFSFLMPAPPSQTLKPNESLTFDVKFSPKDKGKDVGSVVIESGENGEVSWSVPLTADIRSQLPCDLIAKPTQLAFGLVEEGKSKQMTVEVSNVGYDVCDINNLQISSNAGSVFKLLTQLPAQGQLIKSGDSYKVSVAFTPSLLVSYQGNLLISSKTGSTRTFTIRLSGERSRLCLEVVPTSLAFGSSKTGCSVGKKSVQVYNLCNVDVTVGSVALSSSTNKTQKEFIIQSSPQTPFGLKPSQYETVEVSYFPKDLGSDTGVLEIVNVNFSASALAVTLLGNGVDTDEQTDTFKQASLPQLDILFVVDNSCSMRNDQTNLGKNLGSFIQWAAALTLDYHIGVITTDVAEKGCLHGKTKIITSQTPNLIKELTVNVKVGTSGSGSERGLETSRLALSAPSLTGCNKGFYRKDAMLSVVYISDEPDYSTQPVDFYISFLRSLKGPRSPDKLRASAIGPYDASQCQVNGRCRYYLVAQILRGVYSHVTSTQWGSTLSNLGAITFGTFGQFFLSRPAEPKTILVKVNSKIISQGNSGWIYDASSNAVSFARSATPAPNGVIEISYKALCYK